MPDNAETITLFYYWTGSRNSPYEGLRKYGWGTNFKPPSGSVTLSSPLGRRVLQNIECADYGELKIESGKLKINSCEVGFYAVNVAGTMYTAFMGRADDGQVFTGLRSFWRNRS